MLAGPPRLLSFVSVVALVALGAWYFRVTSSSPSNSHIPGFDHPSAQYPSSSTTKNRDPLDFSIPLRFTEGVAKPKGENYSYVVVVGKMKDEELRWMEADLPGVDVVVYEVDNPKAQRKIPKNKGREAMVYLTYLIDNYNKLPDTIIFMHSHKHAWHNNMLMGLDAAQMIKRLNHDRVHRNGYMNVRCHHEPGCPDWIHLDRPGGDLDFFLKPEEIYMRRHIWEQLHPGAPIPSSLSGICCAQFAVSRDRIRQVPIERFHHYRNWLLKTSMDDQWSGRVFEYIWHYIFTGHEVYCPAMNTCYCDGYGFCFGGRAKFADFFNMQNERNKLNEELRNNYLEKEEKARKENKPLPEWSEKDRARMKELRTKIGEMDVTMDKLRNEALERGKDEKMRKEETESWDSEGIEEYLPGKSKGPPQD
ncbi:uncharacterized protein EI97DRAFT_386417 [Westerdykella ornata]|uniref:DUF3431 domain-containing protein n=1 Tax=Westerdykella ornata TaxID=318751 RepID=A0A6A6J6Y1_WESOR|nr:uncharacterized protein EI97DRAFT_386417 [Westerdykella ornata]KAF2272155.1 hypothetical protein EI97DRAFT_386417 [Westerdykella ornata]